MKKSNIFIISIFACLLVSCFQDKGNYDYTQIVKVEVEGVQEHHTVLSGVDPLVITPKLVTSSGETISKNDPNYEFSYSINITENNTYWKLIESDGANLNTVLDLPAKEYKVWFRMKDKRNGVITDKLYGVTVTSVTYEGWLLLGTEGAENKTRMDMISVVSPEKTVKIQDILSTRGLPANTKGAHCFGWSPSPYKDPADKIYIFTDDGGFRLQEDEFTTSETQIINYIDFVSPPALLSVAAYAFTKSNFLITAEGDAFLQAPATNGKFLAAINSVTGETKGFKVAPYIGYNAVRPNIISQYTIFFDVTNKRFLFSMARDNDYTLRKMVGTASLFDWSNVGLDLVYMQGTAFDTGVTFAVLKDGNNKYKLAGITIQNGPFVQHTYKDIAGDELDKAKFFAFHSLYSMMYYAVDNKLYSINWSSGTKKLEATFGAGENITMLKFQLYSSSVKLANKKPEFIQQQYNLIVATHKGTENSGKVQFYKTSPVDYSLSKVSEYDGFCKIKDIIYRERK